MSQGFFSGPITGLGEENFDPTIHIDQVDHGFFDQLDEPSTSTSSASEEHPPYAYDLLGTSSALSRNSGGSTASSLSSKGDVNSNGETFEANKSPPLPLLPIIQQEQQQEEDEETIKLMEKEIEYSKEDVKIEDSLNVNPVESESTNVPRIRLFSEPSLDNSDESGEKEEEEETLVKPEEDLDTEVNYFLSKYLDLTTDSDYSDLTEVSPLSSIAPSPISTPIKAKTSGPIQQSTDRRGEEEEVVEEESGGEGDDEFDYSNEEFDEFGDDIEEEELLSLADNESLDSRSSSSIPQAKQLTGASPCPSTASTTSYLETPLPKGRTYTREQVVRIGHENKLLARKILSAHQAREKSGKKMGRFLRCPASIARIKQQKKIDYENSLLVRKLEKVKPSREIGAAFSKK